MSLQFGWGQPKTLFDSGLAKRVNEAYHSYVRTALNSAELAQSELSNIYDAVLRMKNFINRTMTAQYKTIHNTKDKVSNDAILQLKKVNSKIAKLFLGLEESITSSVPDLGPSLLEKDLGELEIAELSKDFPTESSPINPTYQQIFKNLAEKEAIIEFVQVNHCDHEPSESIFNSVYSFFVAFYLRGGEKPSIEIINIGSTGKAKKLIEDYRQAITGQREFIRGKLPEGKASNMIEQASIAIRDWLLGFLLNQKSTIKTLYIAPDGILSLLPFETLPDAAGSPLNECFEISYISNGADLFHFKNRSNETNGTEPVVFADPNYNLGIRGTYNTAELPYPPLSATRDEGIYIGKVLGVKPLLGDMALKGSLFRIKKPLILHIATHGFFKISSGENSDFYRSIPPSVRSGIALAGANTTLLEGRSGLTEGVEDGILTAEEVAAINLHGTEMVVLSACETGVGVPYPGEGILGLRRAFSQAGAESLILSLWKIPDLITFELMREFYENLFMGLSKSQALKRARSKIRKKYVHPYFWGGFICIGDNRPLSIT